MVTQKMLEAAMVEAVKRGMFPKEAPPNQYITAWEDMRAVLEAAQQSVEQTDCTCKKDILGTHVGSDVNCPVHGR